MIRIQVQIPDALYQRAKKVAEENKWSFAETVRRGLEYITTARELQRPTVPANGGQKLTPGERSRQKAFNKQFIETQKITEPAPAPVPATKEAPSAPAMEQPGEQKGPQSTIAPASTEGPKTPEQILSEKIAARKKQLDEKLTPLPMQTNISSGSSSPETSTSWHQMAAVAHEALMKALGQTQPKPPPNPTKNVRGSR